MIYRKEQNQHITYVTIITYTQKFQSFTIHWQHEKCIVFILNIFVIITIIITTNVLSLFHDLFIQDQLIITIS